MQPEKAGGRRERARNTDLPPPQLPGGKALTEPQTLQGRRGDHGPALPPQPWPALGPAALSPFSKGRFLVAP